MVSSASLPISSPDGVELHYSREDISLAPLGGCRAFFDSATLHGLGGYTDFSLEKKKEEIFVAPKVKNG